MFFYGLFPCGYGLSAHIRARLRALVGCLLVGIRRDHVSNWIMRPVAGVLQVILRFVRTSEARSFLCHGYSRSGSVTLPI